MADGDKLASYERKIRYAFSDEPVMDGMCHIGEEVLDLAVYETSLGNGVTDLIKRLALDVSDDFMASGIIYYLGRMHIHSSLNTWRDELIKDALKSENFFIREAGLAASEACLNQDLYDVLKLHKDSNGFMQSFADDLVNIYSDKFQ